MEVLTSSNTESWIYTNNKIQSLVNVWTWTTISEVSMHGVETELHVNIKFYFHSRCIYMFHETKYRV